VKRWKNDVKMKTNVKWKRCIVKESADEKERWKD